MKKNFRIVFLVSVLLIFCMMLASCTPETKTRKRHVVTGEQKTILYLGDSIAEAVAGPSPISERETYGYYGVLGNINNFKFYNRAISGDKTSDLLSFIQREDDGINMVNSLISSADVIHISIGGNDLLGHDINQMLIDIASSNTDIADAYMATAYENLDKIITKIHDMNPEAIVILQTVYNPIGKDSPLISTRAEFILKSSKAYNENYYHELSGQIINRINDMLNRYLEDNADTFKYEPYYLVDVYSAFEEIYQANPTRWATLFCPDGIHPANEGHAIIAEANQKLFEELGLADANALENYKTLRSEQLTRLYSNAVQVSSIKKSIAACDSFADVTLAYFNAIKGYDADYRHKIVTPIAGQHFEEDKEFNLSTFTIRGLDLLKVYVPSIKTSMDIIDKSQSYISFKADGTFEMVYKANQNLIEILQYLVDWGVLSLPFNLSEIIDLDINYMQSKYLEHMFPGFDYANLKDSLVLFANATGFAVQGIDFTKQATREMANELARSGNLVLTDFDVIGDDLGIKWQGTYRLVEQVSEVTGEKYTAIYINEEYYKGETYLRFTYTGYEDALDTVRLTVDVADVVLEGKER